MQPGWSGYLGVFLASLALAWVFTPLALRLAFRVGALDEVAEHETHKSPIPYLGGVAIVLAFSAAVLAAGVVYRPPGELDTLAIVLGVGVLLSVVGLVDDLRGLPPWVRLLFQAGAGAVVWVIGSGTVAFGVPWLNALVTIVWIVGVTNAFNLLDNMDGLSAGVATLAAGAFFVISLLNGQILVAGLAAAVAGCSLGFLRHNFHPARIFMGDAGSLFLGFMLAVLGARLRLVDTPQVVSLFVPVVVLGVAIFDTTLVTIDRLRRRQSPFVGGRDHTSHRLVSLGVPVRLTVALIYGAGIALGWLALILARLDVVTGLLLGTFVLAIGAFFLVLLSLVPVPPRTRPPTWGLSTDQDIDRSVDTPQG